MIAWPTTSQNRRGEKKRKKEKNTAPGWDLLFHQSIFASL
jgi:hypothetical protein